MALLLALLTLVQWSFLALLGSHLSHLQPLLVVGLTLLTSGSLGALRARSWRVPLKTFLVGVGGIFGYHFCYFAALRLAPAVEANLLNYLWPLLIVLLAPLLLPGVTLKAHHLLGGLLGLVGTALILSGGKLQLQVAYLPGYLLAASAGLIWALYSLLTRRLPPFSTAAVGGFCLASGLLSLGVYALTTPDPWQVSFQPADPLYLLLSGLGPMGLAFFTWDAALKRGDPRLIGALSYLTPLASTLILISLGRKPFAPTSALAMALILGGAILGSKDLFSDLWGRLRSSLSKV